MSKKGRPKKPQIIEHLNLSSFQDEIQIFKNYLIDYKADEEPDPKILIHIDKFFSLDIWQQNLFIVYIIFKDKKKTIKEMAQLLDVEWSEVIREIKLIKKQLL